MVRRDRVWRGDAEAADDNRLEVIEEPAPHPLETSAATLTARLRVASDQHTIVATCPCHTASSPHMRPHHSGDASCSLMAPAFSAICCNVPSAASSTDVPRDINTDVVPRRLRQGEPMAAVTRSRCVMALARCSR